MPNDLELSQEFVRLVLKEQNLSMAKLAELLGCTKGYIGQVCTGKSPLSSKVKAKLIEVFPQYQNVSIEKLSVFSEYKKPTINPNIIDITVFDENRLDNNFKNRAESKRKIVGIDKFFIDSHYTVKPNSHFEVATIASNSLEPILMINDKVLIDVSVNELVNGLVNVFYLDNQLYIRHVEMNGVEIRFQQVNNRNDYFTLNRLELKKYNYDFVGIIVPKVRF